MMAMELDERIDNYILYSSLGSGTYSKVYEAYYGGKMYAIKYMSEDLIEAYGSDHILNEIKVMQLLKHVNTLKLYHSSLNSQIEKADGTTAKVIYEIIELATGGCMFDYCLHTELFSPKVARFYFKQFILGLEYMHSIGYVHLDIKAENMLLDSNYNLKISDFGFSALMAGKDGSGILEEIAGSKPYMAPELFFKQPYSGEKVDIFASGVLLFVMMTKVLPFDNVIDPKYKLFLTNNEAYWQLIQKLTSPSTCTPAFKTLINSFLAYDPISRPTIDQIKKSVWFNEPTEDYEAIRNEFSARCRLKNERIKFLELQKANKIENSNMTNGVYGSRGCMSEAYTDRKSLL